MSQTLQDHPNLDRHIPPGTHFHCPELRWPAFGGMKIYVCDHCMYEMSYLRTSQNGHFFNSVLKEVHRRVKARGEAKKANTPYIHRSLHEDFSQSNLHHDPDFMFPAEDGIPNFWMDLMHKNGFKNILASLKAQIYLTELEEHARHDYWEVRADQADSSWLTVWIPLCNICNENATSIEEEDDIDQEIEFEPNASAWKTIQMIDPDLAENGYWFRISTGDIIKPCVTCRNKEEKFRDDVIDMLEITESCEWVQSLMLWLKQRPNKANICWNSGWCEGAQDPSASRGLISKLLRKQLIQEAEAIMDAKWEEMTTTSWDNFDLNPGCVHHYQKHHGIPPHTKPSGQA